MKRFQKILVGVDLNMAGDAISEGSRRAALQAEWLARETGASLTLLHSTWADLYEEREYLRKGLSAAGTKALNDLAQDYRASDVPVELLTVEGRVWVEMIQRCNRGDNDLIIVARRNDSGSGRLGSVSRKLMRKSPVPVWVVKPDAPMVHRRIMAATDQSEVGDLAVELAASIASLSDCDLDVVHAWQIPLSVQMSESFAEERVKETLAELQSGAEQQINDLLASLSDKPKTQLHVGRDAPSRAITQGVKALKPELLVMGTVSRKGVAGLLMGNTAEKVLDQVECSLLTIKPKGFISPIQ
ncbi:MAG: universal stress protein E [Planctomycetota bacterium]|jgi:universal stress protein E